MWGREGVCFGQVSVLLWQVQSIVEIGFPLNLHSRESLRELSVMCISQANIKLQSHTSILVVVTLSGR